MGDVRAVRDEQAGEAVGGESTQQASRPLRCVAHGPILQRGKLRPTTALPCPAEKMERSEVTSSEGGNLCSPERRLNWAGTAPGPFSPVVSAGKLGFSPLTLV